MTPDQNAEVARRFLAAYAARDLAAICAMVSPDILLRDWNLEVRGTDAFRIETQRNFENAQSITIEVLQLHATKVSAAVEVLITVDDSIRLRVVDVLDIGEDGLVTAVRSYKGLEP